MKNSDEKVLVGAFRVEKKLNLVVGEGINHLYVINNPNKSSNVIF